MACPILVFLIKVTVGFFRGREGTAATLQHACPELEVMIALFLWIKLM